MSERNEKDELNNEHLENDKIESDLEHQSEATADAVIEEQNRGQDDLLPKDSTNDLTQQPAPAKNSAAVIIPWVVAAIAIVALVFVLLNPAGGEMNKTVGKMDGATFKKSDMYTEITKGMQEGQEAGMLDGLMTIKLIELEADKAGATASEDEIKVELDKLKKNFGSDEEFSAALQQYGMTVDALKDQFGNQIKMRKIFEKQDPATEDELKAFYESDRENFATTPKQVQASHILLATPEEAEAVLAQLKAGSDFAALAKEKSQDPGSKDAGGVLPLFGRGEMNEGFETAAFALKKGEMSEVVSAESGFHIIKVTDIVEPVVPAYDEIKADVKLAYYDKKLAEESDAWMEKVKKERNYKNLLMEEAEAEATATASPPASPESSTQAAE